jgi:TolB-like protein/DNA-binding winged helix-turn-helix (wHTH) protein/tetratricopeptide (TPR) repeat protein
MQDRTYRFAQFELNFAEGELRGPNSRVRLQDKPLLLLSALLDQPQRLVTREQLRERMWDRRTVVDYEQGINVAIRKVRDALSDSAENPQFIETVTRKGYRFLLPVSVVSGSLEAPAIVGSEPGVAANPAAPQPIGAAWPSVWRRGWFWAVASALLGALGLGLALILIRPRHAVTLHSLAVLPLQDLSPVPGQDYFADGITEELTTNLAQLLSLRVISRSSVMRYKHTVVPIRQIARELGVEAIVEGAVARSGDRVSVTVQLIDATEDRHLWAQTYDRHVADTMALEAELSQTIAAHVSGALNLKHVELIDSHAVDPQVHELYLMGRYHWNKRTEADLAKAEEYFQQAATRDPTYAPAYAGLADVYAIWPSYGSLASPDTYAKASAAAHHALALDDSLAEAHATLGYLGLYGSSQWGQSEHEFRRALELNPNYASAHIWFAFYLLFSGRREEALAESERARQLDPLSASINAHEAHLLYAARHFEEAKARAQRAIELGPDLAEPHETLALIALESGQAAEALRQARAALAVEPHTVSVMGVTGYVLDRTGHAAEAQKLLATLQDLGRRGSSPPAFPAMIEIGLGQREQAVDTVSGMANIDPGLQALAQWHAFDELNTNPRYQKLLTEGR